MNKRLDDIMGKINDNIINQNYTNFYKFLSQASPYQKIKTKKIIQKTEESKESKKVSESKYLNGEIVEKIEKKEKEEKESDANLVIEKDDIKDKKHKKEKRK